MSNTTRSFKKWLWLVAGGVIILLATAGWWLYFGHNDDNPYSSDPEAEKVGVWELMVVLRSQTASDPEEDRRSSLKRGDVVAVQPEGHQWSGAEYNSYLLIKMRSKKKDAYKLLLPWTKAGKELPEGGRKEEVIRARRYRIDLDKVGFQGEYTFGKQPLKDKIFDSSIIIDKKEE